MACLKLALVRCKCSYPAGDTNHDCIRSTREGSPGIGETNYYALFHTEGNPGGIAEISDGIAIDCDSRAPTTTTIVGRSPRTLGVRYTPVRLCRAQESVIGCARDGLETAQQPRRDFARE